MPILSKKCVCVFWDYCHGIIIMSLAIRQCAPYLSTVALSFFAEVSFRVRHGVPQAGITASEGQKNSAPLP